MCRRICRCRGEGASGEVGWRINMSKRSITEFEKF